MTGGLLPPETGVVSCGVEQLLLFLFSCRAINILLYGTVRLLHILEDLHMSCDFENIMEQAEECKRQYKELRRKQICKRAFYATACAVVGGVIGCV